MVLAICPGKNGNVEELIIEGQGKAGYFLGFQPKIGTEAHRWAGFSTVVISTWARPVGVTLLSYPYILIPCRF
jgi:hypothetical protein